MARGSRPWWTWPAYAGVYVLMIGAVVLGLVFAGYGVVTTLTGRHVLGRQVTAVVTSCQDAGRGNLECVGRVIVGATSGRSIDHLPYDRLSVGMRRTVWESGGSAVVGTPWSALLFDVLAVALLVVAVRAAVQRWRRRAAR